MLLRRMGLAVAGVAAFGLAATATLRFLPEPLRPLDYLLTGSVATLATLVTLFLGLCLRAPSRRARVPGDELSERQQN
jgi:hypothetical protein